MARFGTASNNTPLDTQTQVEALLKNIRKRRFTSYFASWDEFAKGAVKALEQANRTDIKVYSIDLSNEDLQLMQKKTHLFYKIAGEQTPDIYSLEPYLVKKNVYQKKI